MSVPVIFSNHYLEYNFGSQHPFSPHRLEMLMDLFAALGVSPIPVLPPIATRDDVRRVHLEAYVRRVEAASKGIRESDLDLYGLGTSDTPIFSEMDQAARWLVGGTLQGARMISSGEADSVLQLGGGLHHARKEQASGFCVYNDLSVAIDHFRQQGLKVAYIDIDVHHGDGVQWAHYGDPGVLTLSVHQSGRYLYPGTGNIDEIGKGDAVGTKLNIPLEPYTSDSSYLEVFQHVADPALEWFAPDVMIVQCGADAHYLDPLAEVWLSTRGFQAIFKTLMHYGEAYAGGKVLYTLGGGYSADASTRVWTILYMMLQGLKFPTELPEPWLKKWGTNVGHYLSHTLLDSGSDIPQHAQKQDVDKKNRDTANALLDLVRPYWH